MSKKNNDRGVQSPTDEPRPRKGRSSLGRYREARTGNEVQRKVPEGEAFQRSGDDLPQLGKPLEEMTRAELVEIARYTELEIDESMSRDDLIAALRVTPDLDDDLPGPRGSRR